MMELQATHMGIATRDLFKNVLMSLSLQVLLISPKIALIKRSGKSAGIHQLIVFASASRQHQEFLMCRDMYLQLYVSKIHPTIFLSFFELFCSLSSISVIFFSFLFFAVGASSFIS